MKKVILLVAVIALVSSTGLLPFDGTDIAKLHPVEVLMVSHIGNALLLQTDSGMSGTGENIEEALLSLRLSTSGNIFLDTANYLLVTQDCKEQIIRLWDYVRPACQVYYYKGEGKYEEIGKYLESHPSQATVLRCVQEEVDIPLLVMEGESVRIVQ